MRKLLRSFALTFLISGFSFFVADAQWVTIPDANFVAYLTIWHPQCMNGNQMDTTCATVLAASSIFCGNSSIHSLEGIQYFHNLVALDCSLNQLVSLPPLPNSLKVLDCEENQLTSLPPLPINLGALRCVRNQLTILPSLPDSLYSLDCSVNQITHLPSLPRRLRELSCDVNQVVNLPPLPDSLDIFYLGSNPIYCLPLLKYIGEFYFDTTNITCLPNYGHIVYSSPPLNTLPLCDTANPNGCGVYWNISGKVFLDVNNNCLQDTVDSGIQNVGLKFFRGGNLVEQSTSHFSGQYDFASDINGTYTITIDTFGVPYFASCPASGVETAILSPLDSVQSNKNFSLECKPGFDLAAWSLEGRFRPANISHVDIHVGGSSHFYGINCSGGISGNVTISITGPASYVSPAPGALAPDNVSSNVLTYNVADFGNVDFNNSFNIMVQTNTNATIGNTICFTVTVSPITGDEVPTNNVQTHCFDVVTSFDPNNKEVYPSADIDTAQHWLTYTINFQNTGTAEAQHIYVTDTLDSDLDASTFQLLAYSHQPLVQIKENAVRFNFPNINLPDSNTNEPLSHGYVQYKIKLKDNRPIGTQINNTAFIYFDFNSPVVTNTTTNTIAVISSLPSYSLKGEPLRIYPNPAMEVVYIGVDESMIGGTGTVSDIMGRKMAAVQLSTVNRQLSTADFASGVYFVAVTDKEGRSATRKLVIQK
jgi:hypothetical protein